LWKYVFILKIVLKSKKKNMAQINQIAPKPTEELVKGYRWVYRYDYNLWLIYPTLEH
jgi:hypothetical protein